jgi:putative CRISPR-associated protein (TIGR02619 family)
LPGTLICTVGTSLFSSNLAKLKPEEKYREKPPDSNGPETADWNALEKAGLLSDMDALKTLLRDINRAYEASEFGRLPKLLLRLPPDLRLLGAEINSIEAMVRKRFLSEDRHHLILLVSDTEDGRDTGAVLKSYFQDPVCPVRFDDCRVERVEGLQDEKPEVFRRSGLTNLVRLLGKHYRQWGGGTVAINATGGYKAQIALAVAFGQAAGCPVYYKHESFDQVIAFPPIPLSLDLKLIEDNLKPWADLADPGASMEWAKLTRLIGKRENLLERMRPLLETVEEKGVKLCCLSALGQVYWETFFALNPDLTLEPAKIKERLGCRFRDDHYPKGFQDHVRRFYDSFVQYVSECHSVDYSGQPGMETGFYARKGRIYGEYVDGDNFGGRFEIMTAAENELERKRLVKKFNEWV